MANEHRMRARRISALGLSAVLLTVASCDFIPEGGYVKLGERTRGDVPQPAAPPPPAYVAGIAGGGGGAAAVPKLAAGAPADVTQAMVDAGAQSFSTVCAACHGPGGTGTAAAPTLNDNQWINISGSFAEIEHTILTGVPKPKQHPGMMPPRGGGPFTDQQVHELAAYVYSLSHQSS